MSISTINSNISRIQKELADITHRLSLETKKESDCQGRILNIEKNISKNTSESTLKSKRSDIQRQQNEIAKILVKKAELSKKEAEKTANISKLKQDLMKEEEKERKKLVTNAEKERKRISDLEKRQQKEQLNYQKKLREEIALTTQITRNQINLSNSKPLSVNYDLFISHASEDKEEFVRPLAETLNLLGVKVWYDESTLKVGDSLRKSIDHGLINSKFGTVILSSSFFAKNWTQYELDAMVAKEMEGHKMILPIWHKVTKTEVLGFSPTLADKVALNTSIDTIEEIANKLAEVIFSK